MKHIQCLLLLFISHLAFSQTKSFLPVEISIGGNQLLSNDEITPKNGINLSVLKISRLDKRINILTGLSFASIRYYDAYINCGHFCYYKDMNVSMYELSIPIFVRLNTGNKYKFFFESGPSLEIVPIKSGKGIEVSSLPTSVSSTEKDVTINLDHETIDLGLTIGLGCIVPIYEQSLVLSLVYHNSYKSFNNTTTMLSEYFSFSLGIIFNTSD